MKETLYYALAKIDDLIVGLQLALDTDPQDDEDITSATQILTEKLMRARSLATARLPISKRPNTTSQ
jgi:hypothetical protein